MFNFNKIKSLHLHKHSIWQQKIAAKLKIENKKFWFDK